MKSKSTVDELLKIIKSQTGLNQEEIAEKIGYKREYLSQAKKTDSLKLLKALETHFKNDVLNFYSIGNEPKKSFKQIDEEDKQQNEKENIVDLLLNINSNLIETRHAVELNQALAKANLFQTAKLESIMTKKQHQSILEGLNKVTAKIFDEMQELTNQTSEHGA